MALICQGKNKIEWFSVHLSVIYEILEMTDALYMLTLDKNKSLIRLFVRQSNQNFNFRKTDLVGNSHKVALLWKRYSTWK